MEPVPVVTAFARNRDDVLLLRRSEAVGTYRDRWGGVSGHVAADDEDPRAPSREPEAAARAELAEETGLADACELVRAGEPFLLEDDALGRTWEVHPFLFDCSSRDVATNEETAETAWIPPTEILRRETVPALWTSYDHVRPTVATVAADDEHGSAYCSMRALDVLRDRAGELAVAGDVPDDDVWAELATLAEDLLDARPSMAALRTRIDRAMVAADGGAVGSDGPDEPEGSDGPGEPERPNGPDGPNEPREPGGSDEPDEEEGADEADEAGATTAVESRVAAAAEPRTAAAVELAAQREIEAALDADEDAAAVAADHVGGTVLTLSRSGTVLATLRRAALERVVVAESRPAREGVGVAEALAAEGLSATLTIDAAVAHHLATAGVDAVLVGADAVLADGGVVNKVGTRAAALAADREGVPLYAVAARDKVAPDAEPRLEAGDPAAVYDGDADLDVANPTFDATPPELVTAVLTEDGALDAGDVAAVAAEHRALAAWRGGRADDPPEE